MQRLRSHLIGIDSGKVLLFSHVESGGPMWTGSGEREVRRTARFSEPFRAPPRVLLHLEMWDIDQHTNSRVDLHDAAVTREGFEIVLKTWADTRIARARVGWTAIGELAGKDDWDLD